MKKTSLKASIIISTSLIASLVGAAIPNKYNQEAANRNRLNYEGAMIEMDKEGECFTDACLAWKYPHEDFYGRPKSMPVTPSKEIPVCTDSDEGLGLIPSCDMGCVYESEIQGAQDMNDQDAVEQFVLPPSMCKNALHVSRLSPRH